MTSITGPIKASVHNLPQQVAGNSTQPTLDRVPLGSIFNPNNAVNFPKGNGVCVVGTLTNKEGEKICLAVPASDGKSGKFLIFADNRELADFLSNG